MKDCTSIFGKTMKLFGDHSACCLMTELHLKATVGMNDKVRSNTEYELYVKHSGQFWKYMFLFLNAC